MISDEIKNDISGIAALADWLGDGGEPVEPMIAEFRASRCIRGNNGKRCKLNVAPKWWEKAKHLVAYWIRRELEVKSKMALAVGEEDQLHMCKACGCCLPLKVWVPAKHLRDHTRPETLTSTPNYCWMRRELL